MKMPALALLLGLFAACGGGEGDGFFEPLPDAGTDGSGDTAGDTSGDTSTDSGPDSDAACPDSDGDGVCDEDDLCEWADDNADADDDGVPDGCDLCRGADDTQDGDGDGIPDACDRCADGDDDVDTDRDGFPDACDACPLGDDAADEDSDGVPDACDTCPGVPDGGDSDGDGVGDGCDACPGAPDGGDADEDGVVDGCDLCPDGDDSLDADADGVPDGCDQCPGEDDSADADGDGVPDGCDVCTGGDDAACLAACAEGTAGYESFGDTVFGCAASVPFEDRASLCAAGYYPATAEEWIAARGGAAPLYNYWTDQTLRWQAGGDTGECNVDVLGAAYRDCSAGPMRVCAGDGSGYDLPDALGNRCTWSACGWRDNDPVEYFGGCSAFDGDLKGIPVLTPGHLAGTLCVARETTPSATTGAEPPSSSFVVGPSFFRGNVYQATSGGTVMRFAQRHEAPGNTTVHAYVWSGESDVGPWTLEYYSSRFVPGRPVDFEWFDGVHLRLQTGRYYAFGVGSNGAATAANRWNPFTEQDLGWGELVDSTLWAQPFSGGPEFAPSTLVGGNATYPQRFEVY